MFSKTYCEYLQLVEVNCYYCEIKLTLERLEILLLAHSPKYDRCYMYSTSTTHDLLLPGGISF